MEENDFVSIWLQETGNPAIEQLGELNQMTISHVQAAIERGELSDKNVAIALDINLDEIRRWLNGSQIFSIKTIQELTGKIDVLNSI